MGTRYWRWFAALGVVVVLSCIALRLGFGDALVYFYTPDEVLLKREALTDKRIRIGGLVAPASVQWLAATKELSFIVTDGADARLKVLYVGQKPDLFRENQGVVVEGLYDLQNNLFNADRLLVKHSEKYSSKKHTGSAEDKQMLQESLIEQ